MRRIVAYALAPMCLALGALAACSSGATARPSAPGSPANSTPAGGSAHAISFAEKAGGLTRDHAGETINQGLLQGLNTTAAMSKYGVGKLKGAIYGPPYAADPHELIKIGPGQFVVAAATVRLDDPKTALRDMLKDSTSTGSGGTLTDTDPGPLGGSASCLSLTSGGLKVNACYWADRTSFGSVTSFAKDVTQTAEQMRKIRTDIERQT
ncbi:MAG: hypothetical protein JWN52_2076 [Actinomycetia bacterium]|nr:hypothetical protein [Actinomycetes bacterium]